MIINGTAIAKDILNELKKEISLLSGRKPCLAVILVGENPASQIYVKKKAEACRQIGIRSIEITLPSDTKEAQLLHNLDTMNKDLAVDGILLQLPLPPQINVSKALMHISPEKDVDGFHPLNAGKLLIGEQDGFCPCTPLGIKVLLERSGIDITGKQLVILGRSNLVGKPLAALLMQNHSGANATVTVLHSRSENIIEICQRADILIAAIGQPQFVKADMVKNGAVVIDVGINKIVNPSMKNGYQIVGDVDFAHVHKKCSFISPVPGGVGPMTIAMLLSNTLKSYRQRMHSL